MSEQEITAEDLDPTTKEQQEAIDKQNAQAELEQTWPVWIVNLEGDEVPHAFRPEPDFYDEENRPRTGEMNDDGSLKEGHAEKLVRMAKARVLLRAKSEDMAKARALAANPDYHTVASVEPGVTEDTV